MPKLSKRNNVRKVLAILQWPEPSRIEPGANGYILKYKKENDPVHRLYKEAWTYYKDYEKYFLAMRAISKNILIKTGIECKVTTGGNLQIPYADENEPIWRKNG